ncbi:hypothetical protein B0J12DRAFT_561792 [Macrophomina phaseolina]|uniref:Glycosyl transferase CAP10 domain-containing protein n=1 Tax=Macrophomina phaseolina TaxID=35725 RepID=A0ABQ8GZ04_9PEZI|nr:hypothetical protein B0J12DRAFT_561792 [Macrophomina phaseolina]
MSSRYRRLGLLAAAAFVAITLLLSIYRRRNRLPIHTSSYPSEWSSPDAAPTYPEYNATDHPIENLVQQARARYEQLLKTQSTSLHSATEEYHRRYKIKPPPKFDIWYEFASSRQLQLVDEFDTIHHNLLPFWGVEPQILRSRVRQILGNKDNALMGVSIRHRRIAKIEGGPEWQRDAIVGMVKSFVGHLPDMDVAFNLHDEPRVIVPHDDLVRLIARGRDNQAITVDAALDMENSFSPLPPADWAEIPDSPVTPFNTFAHQHTWTHSRLSCPPESPARNLEPETHDNVSAYAAGDLEFVTNHTAFSDICNSPSLSSSFGFFERPNAFSIVQELYPVFSQSKVSTFQDILFPSPWYWWGKVQYVESNDMPWHAKLDRLHWRGSTTGGFSRAHGWKHHHRQHVVERMNMAGEVSILSELENEPQQNSSRWMPKKASQSKYLDMIDVRFSHVGQCDPEDCEEQRKAFDIAEEEDQQEVWHSKHLLDMDGNAFSGRFYAFLQSKSVVYKISLFREWHVDWLQPWLHYVPLSLRGGEWTEVLRFMSEEDQGRMISRWLADSGRHFARHTLRNMDLEVWLFRVLLEYGRVVDDRREVIGYSI